MKVHWTPSAIARLNEIETWIARDSPKAARNMTVRLVKRSLQLEHPPLQGKALLRYAPADVRELLERPYRRFTASRTTASKSSPCCITGN
ncbi:MAG: type II toxin-antitoxin system RelE/ParE family toxin [Pseudoxanthomonas sp.]